MPISQVVLGILVSGLLGTSFLRNRAETSTALRQLALAAPECYEKRRSSRSYKRSVRPHAAANPSRLQNGGCGRAEKNS
jgi:hypothetical protein